MAIQLRRGAYANFDPAKMTPGEPAIVVSGDPNSSDGKSAYVAFAAGDVKRLATHDDMVAEITDITEDIIDKVSTGIEEAIHDDMETASEAAATATQKASDASESAAEAAQTVATIIDPTLSQAGKAADAKATGDAISDLNGAISDVKEDLSDMEGRIFAEPSEMAERVTVSDFTAMDGYVLGGNGVPVASSNYITFYKTFASQKKVYFADDDKVHYSNFLAISTETNGAYTSRLRYVAGSEDDLPSAESPLTINSGTTLFVSCYKSSYTTYGYPSFCQTYIPVATLLNNNLVLNNNQISQIESAIAQKKIKIQYLTGLNTEYATVGIAIYIPARVGYIMYQFVHSVNAQTNTDVWRAGIAYAVDDNLSNPTPITTAGEWECAVKLSGRLDFSGGVAHGDEVVNNIVFYVDGKITDITSISTLAECEELRVVEASTLYDPNDSETIIAIHGSEHVYNKDGMTINQTLVWKTDVTAINAYMAMLPVAKSVTSTFWVNGSSNSSTPYLPITIENRTQYTSKSASKACIYSETAGFIADFSVNEYPGGYNNGDYFLMVDNGSNAYNKCYYAILNSSGSVTYEIPTDTIWKSSTKYSFNKVT